MKYYKVEFETHCSCKIYYMVYYCEAKNAKAAVELARERWKYYGHTEHQFHIKATRVTDPENFSVTTWKGELLSGEVAMGRFFCTDFRTWRVNGRNLY